MTLLALMLGQVALAQHSASHIEHGFSAEITLSHYLDHDEDHHDQDSEKHECPECLLTTSLQTAFYNTPDVLFIKSSAEVVTLLKQSPVVSSARYKANIARAPPTILI